MSWIALFLVCLANAGHLRQVRGSSERSQISSFAQSHIECNAGAHIRCPRSTAPGCRNPLTTLASFLRVFRPLAFIGPCMPCIPGSLIGYSTNKPCCSRPCRTWRRAGLPRAEQLQQQRCTAEGWFTERLGLTKIEYLMTIRTVPTAVTQLLNTDWTLADRTSAGVQDLLDIDKAELRELVLKNPALLSYDFPAFVEPNVRTLQELLSLSAAELRDLILQHPRVLGYDVSRDVKPILAVMQEQLSYDDADLRMALLVSPNWLDYDADRFEKDIVPKLRQLASPESFHQINMDYPGVEVLHRNPDVLIVKNFLTDDECNRVMAKTKPHLQRSPSIDLETGKFKVDDFRTCTQVHLPTLEVPSIISKITALSNFAEDHLEMLQVLRYTEGQQFKKHTDSSEGPIDYHGFSKSGRLVTLFCYLNDVVQGGSTRFPGLDLDIQPQKGMAVVHFPATRDLTRDFRTLHEAIPALNEKWLLTSWIWKHPQADKKRFESGYPALTDDVI